MQLRREGGKTQEQAGAAASAAVAEGKQSHQGEQRVYIIDFIHQSLGRFGYDTGYGQESPVGLVREIEFLRPTSNCPETSPVPISTFE